MIANNPYDRNNAAELDRDDVLDDERRHEDKLVASEIVPEPRNADGTWDDRDDRDDKDDLNAETAPVGVAGSAAVTSQEAADEAHRDTSRRPRRPRRRVGRGRRRPAGDLRGATTSTSTTGGATSRPPSSTTRASRSRRPTR